MTGYELMTDRQRLEWDLLEEKLTHSDTMRWTPLDSLHLGEYRDLSKRLELEHQKQIKE